MLNFQNSNYKVPLKAVCSWRLFTENSNKIIRAQRALSALHIYQTGLNIIISHSKLQSTYFSNIWIRSYQMVFIKTMKNLSPINNQNL